MLCHNFWEFAIIYVLTSCGMQQNIYLTLWYAVCIPVCVCVSLFGETQLGMTN